METSTRDEVLAEFDAWRAAPRKYPPAPMFHAIVHAIAKAFDVPVRMVYGSGKRGTPAKRQFQKRARA